MSRPYFNISAATYSGGILSINQDYSRLRGGGVISITGFSQSVTYSTTQSYAFGEYRTFSITTLGTASSTTYVNPSVILTFSGSPSSTASNTKITLAGFQIVNATSSTTSLSSYLSTIATSVSLTGSNANFVVSAGTNSIGIYAPTSSGNQYNGVTVSVTLTGVTGSMTYSGAGRTFSGGANIYTLNCSHTVLGGADLISLTFSV